MEEKLEVVTHSLHPYVQRLPLLHHLLHASRLSHASPMLLPYISRPPATSSALLFLSRLAVTSDPKKGYSADKQAQTPTEGEPSYVPLLDRDVSLGCFTPLSPTRRLAIRLICHPLFEKGVLSLIVLSSITLALPLLTFPSAAEACRKGNGDIWWGCACDIDRLFQLADIVFTSIFAL